ncbi:magnesium transporter MgtE N-terminal domain-containing protein [Paenibacillus humicola]|uniref:magnesium transporter MgtE N-terminal domain-containing protein n=1 Tax=Paenibacillus humicola TaxID=3110540 RepID=UPI00237A8793|nr:MgtE protein [Paenibacillus humicola]
MADMEMEKQSYSGFERVMFFVTPILFTLILLGVLMTLFNYDLRNKALEIGSSIPLLNKVLPAPETAAGRQPDDETLRGANTAAKLSELQTALTAKEAALAKAAADAAQQAQQINDLQGQVDQLKRVNEEKQLTDEQYQSKIAELANMYAKITPSKAAPILESMDMEDAVLVLNAMRPDDRVSILEKMNPKTAAEATIRLKDAVPAKDMQIAALQARVKELETKSAQPQTVLDPAQLNQTFSQMDPKSAAGLLVKMADVSPSKVLRILGTVSDASRSAIIAEMSNMNDGMTAQLVSKLLAGK